MRTLLFTAEFIRSDGLVRAYIVAPCSERASRFAKEYHDNIGIRVTRISVSRADDEIPPEQRRGLADILEVGQTGFASWCEPLGWFVHATLPARHRLFRIESEDGFVVQVIAANADFASAIWLASLHLGDDGTHPLWRISSSLDGLTERQRAEIREHLDMSGMGIAEWDDERGWSTKAL